MEPRVKETKKMYGWDKYGGGRRGMVIEDLDIWYCQSCKERQSRESPAYMLPLDEDIRREFVRVCSDCKHRAVEEGYTVFSDVVKVVRVSVGEFANLLSLPSRI